jgi:hypothetical protein
MNLTVTGLAVGLVLGLTAAWGGFGAMAIVEHSYAWPYVGRTVPSAAKT